MILRQTESDTNPSNCTTTDSSTDKCWATHLSWKQWRCIRHSFYEPDGKHFFTKGVKRYFGLWYAKKQECPASRFLFKDYDGQEITATCIIEEMEWSRGVGLFKWLRWFWPNKKRRSLDISFSAEVGSEKGSWKGGTLGHGIDMLPGETPEAAFIRYCAAGHRGLHPLPTSNLMAAESTLEKKLVAYAKDRGCLTFKFTSPSAKGVPDRVFIFGGCLFLEIKAPGKKPTPLQMEMIMKLRAQGVPCWWCYDLDQGKQMLDMFIGCPEKFNRIYK